MIFACNSTMKYIVYSFLFISLFACTKRTKYDNKYLDNVSFSKDINLDLPEYSSLRYANNSVLVYNIGIKGVIVFYSGSAYFTWEASDPNHYPSACSQMQPNQFTCECDCEANQYSLYTGQITKGSGDYSLKPYHVSLSGNILHISN